MPPRRRPFTAGAGAADGVDGDHFRCCLIDDADAAAGRDQICPLVPCSQFLFHEKWRSFLAAPECSLTKMFGRKPRPPKHEKRGPEAALSLVSCFYTYFIKLGRVKWTKYRLYFYFRMTSLRGMGSFWGLDKNWQRGLLEAHIDPSRDPQALLCEKLAAGKTFNR